MKSIQRIERLLAHQNVRGLCRALRDRDAILRRRAAQALGELRSSEAIPCLERCLVEDSDRWVQRYAFESLQLIGDEKAVLALARALFNSDLHNSRLAQGALASMTLPLAQLTLQLRELVLRNDWKELALMPRQTAPVFEVIIHSKQYLAWPSGKRKQVLALAAERGVAPSGSQRQILSEMGIFISGVHTITDLLSGIRHRRPDVKIAAAKRLAEAGRRWTVGPLYQRFLQEVEAGSDREVIVVFTRALLDMGDHRLISYFTDKLKKFDKEQANRAVSILAETGHPLAIEALFKVIVSPESTAAGRYIPTAMNALHSIGDQAVDVLRTYQESSNWVARRQLIDLVAYSNHPDQIDILGQLSQDPYADVQQAALDSLARINTREAAHQIASLTGTAPREWIIFALAKITDPAGPELLKALLPNLTTITGKVINFNGEPLADVMIQVFEIQDRDGTLRAQSLSQRAISGSNGDFALSLPDVTETSQPLMKVVKLSNQYGQDDEVFENELPLRIGADNLIEARTDQFFNKLHIRVERLADSQ